MKKIFYILLFISFTTVSMAQTLDDMLSVIENNNIEIKAAKALYEAQSMEARSQNMLGNTSVGYERMLGTISYPEKTGKITVSQELEFPSIYAIRGKMNREKINKFQYDYEETRRSVLLEAKELCLDLSMLGKQNELINERLANIEKLKDLYQKRFDTGDIGKIEMNKIIMQEMNERAALTVNINETNRVVRKLSEMNGGKEFPQKIHHTPRLEDFPDFARYSSDATAADTRIKISQGEYDIAVREHKVARNKWLPAMELSYIREIRPAETSNGFEIGISLPLWNNLRKVKQTKAYKAYSLLQMEKVRNEVNTDIRTDYDEAYKLWETLRQYDISLVYENIRLIEKTLESKQISLIDYFTEINSLYEIIESYNRLQNSYEKAIARMYKFRL